MKRIKRSIAICICAVAVLSGCTKFYTATIVDFTPESFKYDTVKNELICTAIITDDGGCYYREQGFCYRLDTLSSPNLNDVFSHQIVVDDHGDPLKNLADTFSAIIPLPSINTSYYVNVRAYVRNSAGVSYNNDTIIYIDKSDPTEPEK